jgi:hypothetical protein
MSNDVLDKFLSFSASLANNLSLRPEVIGLVLVGSTADISRVDEWSDHDFFVFTKEGEAETLRQDLSWLPDHEQIAMRPRETAHGLKVVYESGQVLEFAVFNDSELEIVSVNDYSVAVDKTNIAERMNTVAERKQTKHASLADEFELFLANILIGVGRARRGEVLIAGQHIRSYCIDFVLGLLRNWHAPTQGAELRGDSLNRFRRFEIQYPEFGRRLERLAEMPVEASAKALVEFVVESGSGHLTKEQLHSVFVVRNRLGWN